MRFAFTDDQTLFAEGLRDLLAKECTPGARARRVGRRRRSRRRACGTTSPRWACSACSCPKPPAAWAAPRSISSCCSRSSGGPPCRARCSRPRRSSRPRSATLRSSAPRRSTGRRTCRTRTSRRWCSCPAACPRPQARRLTAVDAHRRRAAPVHRRRRRGRAVRVRRGARVRPRRARGCGVPRRPQRAHDRRRGRVRPPARAVRPPDRREPGGEAPPGRRAAEGRVRQARGVPRRMVDRRGRADPQPRRVDGQGVRQRRRLPVEPQRDAGARRDRLHVGSRPAALDEEGVGAATGLGRRHLPPPPGGRRGPRRTARDPRRPRVRDDPAARARQRRPAFPSSTVSSTATLRLDASPSSPGAIEEPRARSSPPGSSRAIGSACGRPTSASGSSPRSGRSVRGGVLVPLNTRFKGTEAAYVLDASGARFLCTVNGFLGTDYVAMLRDAGRARTRSNTSSCCRATRPSGTTSFADFLARAGEVSVDAARARADAVRPDDVADIIFTSGTTGKPKGAMTTHAQTLRTFDAWANTVGLAEGDRYLVVNPFFHTFGYKAGIVACFIQGATIVPEPVFDVPAVLAHVAAERISDAAGTAHAVPLDPRPSRPRLVRPVVAAARGHRRGRGAGRDDPPHARGAHLPHDRHRLRAHRVDGHGVDLPPRRRPGDDLAHVGTGDGRCRGEDRRRRRQRGATRASRARSCAAAST